MNPSRLYAIIDQKTAEIHGWSVPNLARAYLSGGARLIQVRVTSAASGQFLRWCDQLVEMSRPYRAQIIINNRADLALLAGADGVHVGQEDLTITGVRRVLSRSAVVGVSTHSVGEVNRSVQDLVSYVAVGPIYQTKTIKTRHSAVGLSLVRYASRVQSRPVVAIGGITLERSLEVIDSGASAVAVISDLFAGDEPVRRVANYVELLDSREK